VKPLHLERVQAMPYYLWRVCLYNIFPHYLINGTMANGSNPICQWVKVQHNSYILPQTQHDHPYCYPYKPTKLMWAQIKRYLCNKTFNLFNSKWLLSTSGFKTLPTCLACQTKHNYLTSDSGWYLLMGPTKDTAHCLFQILICKHIQFLKCTVKWFCRLVQ
jgi:hypothetical protein